MDEQRKDRHREEVAKAEQALQRHKGTSEHLKEASCSGVDVRCGGSPPPPLSPAFN